MKKKFLTVLLAALACVCLCFGLAACGENDAGPSGGKDDLWTVERLYAEAQSRGFEGSLDDLIALFKGEDGTNGKSAYDIWLENGHSGSESDFLDWLKGDTGETGPTGPQGPQGSKGTDGEDGKDGSNGKSAYDIWKENGHSGTEAEFLEWLKGEKGETGAMGPQGPQGQKGDDGTDGKDGKDGVNGKSAYDIWLENGHSGSESDFLEWLRGENATAEGTYGLHYYLNPDGRGYTLHDIGLAEDRNIVIPDLYNGLPVTAIAGMIEGEQIWGFFHVYWIESIKIGNNVTSIGNDAFSGCTGLKSVTFGSSVTSIGEYAFEGCSALTSIVIPDGVTSIGRYTFNECRGLTSIVIPDSVTSIGNDVFEGCSGLQTVYYKGTPSAWRGIQIDNPNSDLTEAALYYYSAQMPSAEQWEESPKWWHYAGDGETVVLWTKAA